MPVSSSALAGGRHGRHVERTSWCCLVHQERCTFRQGEAATQAAHRWSAAFQRPLRLSASTSVAATRYSG